MRLWLPSQHRGSGKNKGYNLIINASGKKSLLCYVMCGRIIACNPTVDKTGYVIILTYKFLYEEAYLTPVRVYSLLEALSWTIVLCCHNLESAGREEKTYERVVRNVNFKVFQ